MTIDVDDSTRCARARAPYTVFGEYSCAAPLCVGDADTIHSTKRLNTVRDEAPWRGWVGGNWQGGGGGVCLAGEGGG
eukprot:COSAG02_NODE_32030_length_523_cov_0.912736_1_plen_76_part_01